MAYPTPGVTGVRVMAKCSGLASSNLVAALSALIVLVMFAPANAAPTPGPATKPAEAPDAKSSTFTGTPDDLDAEQKELERERRVIDEKLAQIAARRKGQNVNTAATKQEPAVTEEGIARPDDATSKSVAVPDEIHRFSIHGQTTVITEKHDVFHAPYTGVNSLPRHEGEKTSITATLFLGAKVWDGGELYFNPEIAGGEGFGGVTGIAGFPNGEIPRVGTPEPRPYIGRLFLRQTFGLGGEKEKIEDGQNQIAGFQDARRITITVGKFGAIDSFQSNGYSNDPRTQFENWALFTNGAWDYPADVRGYTEGAVIEYTEPSWSLRYGAMAEPTQANGATLSSRIPASLAHALEFEARYKLGDHSGVARFLGYANSAHMGKYRQAVDEAGQGIPDVTKTRAYRIKYGFGLSAEQEITKDLGVFTRVGWNDGHSESWAFTEIDQSASLGLSLKGTRWKRPDDVFGVAGVLNGLSKDHRDYLRTGGHGFLIGDGRLTYGLERIVEGYYLIKLADHIFVTGDVQYIDNPAYNRDRGPVLTGGVRVHVEY
jgi:high affinity Mn2+ porin